MGEALGSAARNAHFDIVKLLIDYRAAFGRPSPGRSPVAANAASRPPIDHSNSVSVNSEYEGTGAIYSHGA
jgi:hypothetical protein